MKDLLDFLQFWKKTKLSEKQLSKMGGKATQSFNDAVTTSTAYAENMEELAETKHAEADKLESEAFACTKNAKKHRKFAKNITKLFED